MNAKIFFYTFGQALYRLDGVYTGFARESGAGSATLLWILYALNDGREHSQHEICQSWDLPKSTVNTIMKDLVKKGFVTLVPIKGKRREMLALLTDSGKAYAESLLADIYAKEAAVFKQLNDEDLQVTAILEKMTALLKEQEKEHE